MKSSLPCTLHIFCKLFSLYKHYRKSPILSDRVDVNWNSKSALQQECSAAEFPRITTVTGGQWEAPTDRMAEPPTSSQQSRLGCWCAKQGQLPGPLSNTLGNH